MPAKRNSIDKVNASATTSTPSPAATTSSTPVSAPTISTSTSAPTRGHKTKTPSAELAAIVGSAPITRMNALKGLWTYVKVNKLQLPNDKRTIHPDDKLQPLFSDKDFPMRSMLGVLSKNLK